MSSPKTLWVNIQGHLFPKPFSLCCSLRSPVCHRRQGRAIKDLESPIKIVGATKWCVFRPTEVTRQIVEEAVRERMDRMQSTRVDLLQVRYGLPDSIPSISGYFVDGSCHEVHFIPIHPTDASIDLHPPLSHPYSSTGMTIPTPVTSPHFNYFKTCKGKV